MPHIRVLKKKKFRGNSQKESLLTLTVNLTKVLGKLLKNFFENSWIDATVKKGKNFRSFFTSHSTKLQPKNSLNFQGKIRDVMTLAHELGHGIHQYLANKMVY